MTETDKKQTTVLDAQDKMNLDFNQMNRKLALSAAKEALAQHETVEANYKVFLFQLYFKYGLNPETDQINEKGEIVRGTDTPQKEEVK